MPDREKVIKGLEHCTRPSEVGKGGNFCMDCPYTEPVGFNQFKCNSKQMMRDALALLKEQEAVEPHYNARTNWYECGNCHYSMTSGMHCRSELIPATKVRYCANCGFPVSWGGR